jgi:hypothetical protein
MAGVQYDQLRSKIEAYQKGWQAYEEKREVEAEILSQALQTILATHDPQGQDRAEVFGAKLRRASDIHAVEGASQRQGL